MPTDLVISVINKDEAMRCADIVEHENGKYFMDHYGVGWTFKFASFAIAAFIRARIRELGMWGYSMSDVKSKCDVQYIHEMFELNEIPFWLGDTTTEMLINTYLLAFLHDGKHVDYDETENELEEVDGFTVISGDYAKYHSTYKGWKLYRAWNVQENHGKMRYFGVSEGKIVEAKNLSGIKYKVSAEDDYKKHE